MLSTLAAAAHCPASTPSCAAAAHCPASTPSCGAWCSLVTTNTSTPCVHPDPAKCTGDYCCLDCGKYLAYLVPRVPLCTCAAYKAAACFANDCVPCSTECFPHNQSGAPLGKGVLCTNSASCEPCCQHKHATQWCQLECPCDSDSSDCDGVGLT